MKQDLKDFELSKVLQRPLQSIEQLITIHKSSELTEGGDKRLHRLVLVCMLALAGKVTKEDDFLDDDIESKATAMLDDYLKMENKSLNAACWVQLLNEFEWVKGQTWRPKVMEFLHFQYRENYKEWRIDAHDQTHERIPKLIDIFKKQENAFFNLVKLDINPNRIPQYQSNIMDNLHNREGRAFTLPFFPGDIDNRIRIFFDALKNYLDSQDGPEIIDSYRNFVDAGNEFNKILISFDTRYSCELSKGIISQLIEFIQNDFLKNKAAQPASLFIESHNKKYPLHLVGNQVKIGFKIKNAGPGYAYDTSLQITDYGQELKFLSDEINIGRLSPNESQLLEFPAKIINPQEETSLIVLARWKNYTGEEKEEIKEISIRAQRSDINWHDLKQSDPYSLEPTANEQELIGRKDVLNRLIGSLKNDSMNSAIIQGQKRVGKTSIAKALKSHLESLGYISIYLEAGDYVEPKAKRTIARLGTKLCNKIIDSEPRVKHIPVPLFDDAFSPFTDFLDEVERIVPDRRIVFILDEFDELPLELYIRGEVGDSFFLTLRSITARKNVGFVLVGGEKMVHIMDYQGDKLNKWSVIQVDYFSREQDWSDYQELIQRPAQNILEFTGDALGHLHDLTAGNPYFTNLLCQQVFQKAVKMRDCSITPKEIQEIMEPARRETAKNTFQHFWDDGIFNTEKATEKSIRRRKILISLADLCSKQNPVAGRRIQEYYLVKNEPALESDLREFVTRKVLKGEMVGNFPDHLYDFYVKFFYEWLRERGIQDIISTFPDLDAASRQRQQEEAIRIQSIEIVELSQRWGSYRGQKITEDKIRAWLEQFSSAEEQRSMYKILTNVRFITNSHIRVKMKEAHETAIRGLGQYKGYRQQKRPNIIVSYLDGPGKSGSSFARLYAVENKILIENVVENSRLPDVLGKKGEEISSVIFLDDFVGTGFQASENLQKLNEAIGNVVREKNLRLTFIALVAYEQGWAKVNETIETNNLQIVANCCELLRADDCFFSESSKIFDDSTERETTKEIVYRYGRALLKDNPLGFGDIGIAVVFEDRCPNDTLPILWKENTNPKWVPLFKRL
jgi:hypothetical protein